MSTDAVRVRVTQGGSGPPVVLLHDFLGRRSCWEPAARQLAGRHRIVALDLPGFGESEKPSPERYAYTTDALADAVVDVMCSVGAHRASLCGIGLGAAVCAVIASRQPEMVCRLALVGPSILSPSGGPFERLATWPFLGGWLMKQMPSGTLLRRYFARYHGRVARTRERQFAELREDFSAPAAREAALAVLRRTHDTRAIVAALGRIQAPTLLAWGCDDQLQPAEEARRLLRLLRQGEIALFPCGHSPPEEEPERFVSTLTRFLNRNGGRDAAG